MQRKFVGSRVLEILERNRSAGISFLIALSVLLLYQVTKATVIVMFSLYESIPVMSYLNVGYWKNTGAAFSFLANADGWQRPLLILVGVAASYWLGRLILASQSTWIEKVAYAFILGGAMSNVFDRIFRGAVVDWIDLYWKSWHWPAFNVADMGITLGATIIILLAFVRVDGDRNGCSRARRSHHRGGA